MFKGLANLGIWPFTWLYYRKVTLPKPETLVPQFVDPEMLLDGEFRYNPDFYVIEETALAIMRRFNALVMFKKVIQDAERYAPQQWWVRFDDGLEVNCGQLAKFFAQYPDTEYPGIAFRFGLGVIGYLRAAKKQQLQEEFRQE